MIFRFVFCFSLAIALLRADNTIIVDMKKKRQKIVMMGTDMERSAHFLQQAQNKDEVIEWMFKDIQGMDYLRVDFNKKQELVEGEQRLKYYTKQVESMQQIKKVRPSIKFWATLRTDYDGYGTENNLPDWIYTGGGYNGGKYEPDKLNEVKYARFIADYLVSHKV